VYLTNKYHERRQTTLLAHEKQKYQSEQKFTLKKEVFLDVARSFADVLDTRSDNSAPYNIRHFRK
jgi:hypothetical protein